jgi:thymidylate synthase (FAD)
MIIVKPSVEIYFHFPTNSKHGTRYGETRFLEVVGRTCYKSEDKMTEDSSSKFVKKLNDLGHMAMLEHCVASVRFVCDRGVSHELVRHRLCSFAQESTRYCNYSKDKFDKQISVIEPPGLDMEQTAMWRDAVLVAEKVYMAMLETGVQPQIARSVLPTCLKTEIWMTANLREWQHIFKLRTSVKAHPQMKELMDQVLVVFKQRIPEMYSEL